MKSDNDSGRTACSLCPERMLEAWTGSPPQGEAAGKYCRYGDTCTSSTCNGFD